MPGSAVPSVLLACSRRHGLDLGWLCVAPAAWDTPVGPDLRIATSPKPTSDVASGASRIHNRQATRPTGHHLRATSWPARRPASASISRSHRADWLADTGDTTAVTSKIRRREPGNDEKPAR